MSPGPSLRVGAIDVGSNAIRFLAAEFSGPGRFEALESFRAPVRLGHDAFRTGRLGEEATAAGIEVLASFRRRMDALAVARYRAVATSAVRESANGEEFVARAREEAGIRLEPISGDEEARLVWLAVRSRVDLGGREWVLADLGGGSLEVSRGDAERLHHTESRPLGAVRLLEDAEREGDASPDGIGRLLDASPALRGIEATLAARGPAGMIATGGNIDALADVAGAEADARGVRVLPLADLRRALGALAPLSPRERVARFGLREDRADVIVPAALVYERVARAAGADGIVVPGVGVREGLLLEAAARGEAP